MSNEAPNQARVIPLRPQSARQGSVRPVSERPATTPPRDPAARETRQSREPLWRDLVGDVLRRERLAQERTLKDVADAARISMPYLSEVERGRKEASSEVLAAAAQALGLGLGDLLSLAQGELTRHSARSRRAVPGSPYNGMCLAA
ncbi:helix-turn-helix domain-containing protein [Streptomyces sp. NPDC058307]|uniref:helix-turn-helix domain-containing protein n=1 Tax=Streptomyces sp. NPDC058307 TaxID=3346439 RepID=UPI0036E1EDC2